LALLNSIPARPARREEACNTAFVGGPFALLVAIRRHSFGEEIRDELDGCLRIFFHDPVAGVWNNAASDMSGDELNAPNCSNA
jgi:hypothetical protein